jgi:hypothetical protein
VALSGRRRSWLAMQSAYDLSQAKKSHRVPSRSNLLPPRVACSRGLRGCLLLHFPAFAREQYRAWHYMLAAGVIGDLPAREPQSFRR